MAAFAQLFDYLHHVLVCKRAAARLARRLSLAETSAPATPGQRVQRRGRIEPLETLVAPLSGKAVVGYRVLIEVPAPYWMNRRVVVDFGLVGAFVLRDTQGTLRIDPGPAQLIVAKACLEGLRGAGSPETLREFPSEVASVLADRAQLRAEGSDPHRYQWAEYHLHAGDEVLVDGVFGAAEGSGDRLGGSSSVPLLVTSRQKNELLGDLRNPSEAILRQLPAPTFSDRTGDQG